MQGNELYIKVSHRETLARTSTWLLQTGGLWNPHTMLERWIYNSQTHENSRKSRFWPLQRNEIIMAQFLPEQMQCYILQHQFLLTFQFCWSSSKSTVLIVSEENISSPCLLISFQKNYLENNYSWILMIPYEDWESMSLSIAPPFMRWEKSQCPSQTFLQGPGSFMQEIQWHLLPQRPQPFRAGGGQ